MKKCLTLITLLIFCIASAVKGQSTTDFVVAADGSGNFKTVQEAINAVPDFRKNQTTILIKAGVYKEKLVIPKSKSNLKLLAEDALKTKITFDDYASKKNKFGEEMGTT